MNIIDEAMEKVYDDAPVGHRQVITENIRAAIEHAVRRCAEIADSYFARMEGTSYDVVGEILRKAGLK